MALTLVERKLHRTVKTALLLSLTGAIMDQNDMNSTILTEF